MSESHIGTRLYIGTWETPGVIYLNVHVCDVRPDRTIVVLLLCRVPFRALINKS